MPRLGILAFALLLALPSVLAIDPLGLQDDASTGGDAADAIGDATPLLVGDHVGELTGSAVDAQDWFLVSPRPDQTMMVRYAATLGEVFFRVVDAQGTPIFTGFSSGGTYTYAGVTGATYRIGFTAQDPNRGATYAFSLRLDRAPQFDAGLAGDAAGSRSAARPIPEGTIRGTLDPIHADVRDWYDLTSPPATWTRVTIDADDGGRARIELWSAPSYPVHAIESTGAPQFLVARGGLDHVLVTIEGADAPVSYALTVEYIPMGPMPQDDAGTGTDAPATPDAAPLVALGVWHEAVLEHHDGDELDQYRVEVPAGRILQVTVHSLEWHVHYGIDGTRGRGALPGDTTMLLGGGPGIRTLQVSDQDVSSPTQARYRFRLDAVVPPDVALVSLRVDPPDEDFVRNIRLEIANLGEGTVSVGIEVRVAGTFSGEGSLFAVPSIHVGPGQTIEQVVRWDTRSWVGDLRVSGELFPELDFGPGNERIVLEERQAGFVGGGLGIGVGAQTFVL